MRYCTRLVEFDSAHRVMNHESKCRNLHGHRYKIEITAMADELDSIGRVIDFSVLKNKIGSWIDDNWDHTTILNKDDSDTIKSFQTIPKNKPIYLMSGNPTAENMASYLLREICPKLLAGHNVTVTKIRVYETPNCYAEDEI